MNKAHQQLSAAAKVAMVMGIILRALSEMDFNRLLLLQKEQEVVVPVKELQISHLFGSLSGYDILKVEECLIDFTNNFGFELKFLFLNEEMQIRISPLPEREPPGDRDDGDDDPHPEFEEGILVEETPRYFVKSANGSI